MNLCDKMLSKHDFQSDSRKETVWLVTFQFEIDD